MGKIQINHKSYDLPDQLIEQLQLRRRHDQRAKRSVISIRFAAGELERLQKAHQQSDTWYPFSVWLHNLVLFAYPLLLQEGARPASGRPSAGRAAPDRPTFAPSTHLQHRRGWKR